MRVQRYSMAQIMVHWTVVLLVLVQFFFSEGMEDAFETAQETGSNGGDPAALLHIASGLLILALSVYRLVLRRKHGTPPLPEAEPDWQKLIAKITHNVLIALLIVMPIGGMAAWFGGSELAAEMHGLGASLLFVLLVLHVGAAFYGQYIARRGTMDRMRPLS